MRALNKGQVMFESSAYEISPLQDFTEVMHEMNAEM
jgi:hypothetical protein